MFLVLVKRGRYIWARGGVFRGAEQAYRFRASCLGSTDGGTFTSGIFGNPNGFDPAVKLESSAS